MKHKSRTSFIIFFINFSLSVGVIVSAILFEHFGVDKKNAIYLAFTQFLVAMLAPLGVYSAIKFQSDVHAYRKRNRLTLWGNLVLLSYTLGLMVYALTL